MKLVFVSNGLLMGTELINKIIYVVEKAWNTTFIIKCVTDIICMTFLNSNICFCEIRNCVNVLALVWIFVTFL